MTLSKSANTHVGCRKALENFLVTFKSRLHLSKISFFESLKGIPVLTWLEGGMKTEKSLSTHVWNRKICLKHCVVLPFVSADSYDPRQVCEHTPTHVRCQKALKNFLVTFKGT